MFSSLLPSWWPSPIAFWTHRNFQRSCLLCTTGSNTLSLISVSLSPLWAPLECRQDITCDIICLLLCWFILSHDPLLFWLFINHSHTLLCYFLFRKPFFFRKFKIQKLWVIYHGHSSITTGSFGYSISLAFVSSEILHPSQPHSAVTDKSDLFLEENLLHPICSPPSQTYLRIDRIGNHSRGPHCCSLRQSRSCPVIAPTVCSTLVCGQGKPTGAALIKLY